MASVSSVSSSDDVKLLVPVVMMQVGCGGIQLGRGARGEVRSDWLLVVLETRMLLLQAFEVTVGGSGNGTHNGGCVRIGFYDDSV